MDDFKCTVPDSHKLSLSANTSLLSQVMDESILRGFMGSYPIRIATFYFDENGSYIKVTIKGDEVRMMPINFPIPTAFMFGFVLALIVIK